MAENVVNNYGWASAEGPNSCGYITPRVLTVLRGLGVKRVLDVGAGNGKLCSVLQQAGYQVSGVEYDREGVELARAQYPAIRFHQYGIQDDPGALLAHEGEAFDAVVSTEVIEHLFSPHLLPIYAAGVLKEGGTWSLPRPTTAI